MYKIVTGAGRNIGKGIVKVFIENGYDCIAIDKDEKLLEDLTNELDSDKIKPCVLDISNTEALQAFISWINNNNIEVDALINNAGIEEDVSLLELTPEVIGDVVAANISGPFYLTSQIVKNMKKGSVVFISSVHSQVIRTHPIYSSTKAAIEMFVKEAAIEVADKGIRVNAVAPGPVKDTKHLKQNKYVPTGNFLQPKDIANTVKFLVSDESKNITGTTIVVDGGFSLTHTHYWKSKKAI